MLARSGNGNLNWVEVWTYGYVANGAALSIGGGECFPVQDGN